MMIKVAGLGWKEYWSSGWNKVCSTLRTLLVAPETLPFVHSPILGHVTHLCSAVKADCVMIDTGQPVQLDAFLVLLSVVDIAFSYLDASILNVIKVFKAQKLLRLLRMTRIAKALKSMNSVLQLLSAIYESLGAMAQVCCPFAQWHAL
jgi:hypothetical protein